MHMHTAFRRKYIGAAFTVENEMSCWDRKEISKLNRGKEAPEGIWTGLVKVLNGNGIVTHLAVVTVIVSDCLSQARY